MRFSVFPVLFFCACGQLTAAAPETPPADVWVTNQIAFPRQVSTQLVQAAEFKNLHAETSLDRYLLVLWGPEHLDTNAVVTLEASAGELSHRLVRDWRAHPMHLSGTNWAARPPVDGLYVPVVYFIRAVSGGVTNISPMRACDPAAAGLVAPSRPFWPFLEGFEQGTESWQRLPDQSENAPMETDPTAKSGLHSLKVSLPPDQHSVSVATARIHGWQLVEQQARGVGLWLRTKSGIGKARFALHANAFETNHLTCVSSVEADLTDHWQKVLLPLSTFSNLPVAEVDWFTIEFMGAGPTDFLVDDVQLLGLWKLEGE